jgi:ribulose-phosphate 3-epimerase
VADGATCRRALIRVSASGRRTPRPSDRAGSRAVLEVDGGITTATIAEAWTAGADTFVAGTAVFGAGDPAHAVRELRRRCAVPV